MNHMRLGMIGILLFTVSCGSGSPSASISSRTSEDAKASGGPGQGSSGGTLGPVDLTAITRIECKGRVQDGDYTRDPVVDQLIAEGLSCIPFLIDHLEDEAGMNPGVVGCWNRVTVADIALMILSDLFRDSSWEKSTVPEAEFNSIIEYPEGSGKSAEQALREYVRKHGRAAIKTKWSKIWNENRERIFWDESERCFNIRK